MAGTVFPALPSSTIVFVCELTISMEIESLHCSQDCTILSRCGLEDLRDCTDLVSHHCLKKWEEKESKAGDTVPRTLGPADVSIHTHKEGPTVQLCGDSNVFKKSLHSW